MAFCRAWSPKSTSPQALLQGFVAGWRRWGEGFSWGWWTFKRFLHLQDGILGLEPHKRNAEDVEDWETSSCSGSAFVPQKRFF